MNWSSPLLVEPALAVLLVLFSIIGWIISFYFYQVYHHRIPEDVWWMPRILRVVGSRCEEIVGSAFGSTFGRSNAFWGLWYYVLLVLGVVGNTFWGTPGTSLLFVVALLALAFSIYLTWGLYTLKAVCRACLGVHSVNLIIFVALLYQTYPLLLTS